MSEVLPILLSVPHAGYLVPEYAQPFCRLDEAEIVADGDVGARAIYDLEDHFAAFARTDVARAVVDLNREEGDLSKDGIIKTHTCWDVPVWRADVPQSCFDRLIREHHRPYHARLTELAIREGLVLAIDGHTMAEVAPPVAPDAGQPRPMVCLGDGRGRSCPREYVDRMQACMQRHFPGEVTINRPFAGGYITRRHGAEMPWLQVEMSRAEPDGFGVDQKRAAFLAAVREWHAST